MVILVQCFWWHFFKMTSWLEPIYLNSWFYFNSQKSQKLQQVFNRVALSASTIFLTTISWNNLKPNITPKECIFYPNMICVFLKCIYFVFNRNKNTKLLTTHWKLKDHTENNMGCTKQKQNICDNIVYFKYNIHKF